MSIPEKSPELIAMRQKGAKAASGFKADDAVSLIGTIPGDDIDLAHSRLDARNWWRWQLSHSGKRFMNFMLGRKQ